MSWETICDVAGAICLVLGSTLTFVAGLGAFRLPNLLSRQHAATKPQVLGLALMMLGLALTLRVGSAGWTLLLVVAFQLITSPISAHMLSRAGYRTGKVDPADLVVDEFTRDLEAARRANGEE